MHSGVEVVRAVRRERHQNPSRSTPAVNCSVKKSGHLGRRERVASPAVVVDADVARLVRTATREEVGRVVLQRSTRITVCASERSSCHAELVGAPQVVP